MQRILALALPSVLLSGIALAQAGRTPEFEVASIRQSQKAGLIENRTPTLDVPPGGTLRIDNLQLRDIIMLAYDVGMRQIVGPNWLSNPSGQEDLDTPRFNIIAKVPDDAPKGQVQTMLRNLLAERFKLQVHRESRTMQVFALEVAKGGLKLHASAEDGTRLSGSCARTLGQGPEVTITAVCERISFPELAEQLQLLAPGYFRGAGPVIDKTGLTGRYDLSLEWITIQDANAGAGGPTVFKAVEKLGLTLDRRKEEAEVLVVDHCEMGPTEN